MTQSAWMEPVACFRMSKGERERIGERVFLRRCALDFLVSTFPPAPGTQPSSVKRMLMKNVVPMPETKKTASGGSNKAVITSISVAKNAIFGGAGSRRGRRRRWSRSKFFFFFFFFFFSEKVKRDEVEKKNKKTFLSLVSYCCSLSYLFKQNKIETLFHIGKESVILLLSLSLSLDGGGGGL